MTHFVVITRHLSEYCGEDQPFDIDFTKIQDTDRPYIIKCKLEQVLKKVLSNYFSEPNVDKFISEFLKNGISKIDKTTLLMDEINNKKRYSVIQEIGNLTIQCIDNEFIVPSFSLIMAEIYEF